MLTNILGNYVYQLQTSLTPVNLVHLALFTIPYRMNSPCTVPCVFGILTIIIHTLSRLNIQYNQRSLLWKYIWIFVQQLMN